MIITVEHIRIARDRHGGYCVSGMETWFKSHGMSLREFLQHGYPLERIAAIGDEMSRRVIEIATEGGT